MGNELGSGQERVQTQQTMARWGTAGNGISGGLQMCQLECELHVRYANERRAIWLGMHGPCIPQQPATVIQDSSEEVARAGGSSLYITLCFTGY